MSYGAITTESAMCRYFDDFSCVKRTVRTSGVQIKTGPVWEANFQRADFSVSDSNSSGECRVTDSSDSWISLFTLVPNAQEDAYMFEGFTPGEATFQASSLAECNESATNYTLALRACSVESSMVSGGKMMCGEFTNKDVFAFNMKTLASAGLGVLLGIMLLCIARCCATSSEGHVAKVQPSSNSYTEFAPVTLREAPRNEDAVVQETALLTGGQATAESKDDPCFGFFNNLCSGCSRAKPLSQRPH